VSAEAELTGDWEQSTLWLCRNDGGGPSAFLHAAEGILIDSPCRVEIKSECPKLIEDWLQPVDDSFQPGMHEDTDGSHDGQTFTHGQCSHCNVISQQQRGIFDKRSGNHRGSVFEMFGTVIRSINALSATSSTVIHFSWRVAAIQDSQHDLFPE